MKDLLRYYEKSLPDMDDEEIMEFELIANEIKDIFERRGIEEVYEGIGGGHGLIIIDVNKALDENTIFEIKEMSKPNKVSFMLHKDGKYIDMETGKEIKTLFSKKKKDTKV